MLQNCPLSAVRYGRVPKKPRETSLDIKFNSNENSNLEEMDTCSSTSLTITVKDCSIANSEEILLDLPPSVVELSDQDIIKSVSQAHRMTCHYVEELITIIRKNKQPLLNPLTPSHDFHNVSLASS
jgi:hypothetical protein